MLNLFDLNLVFNELKFSLLVQLFACVILLILLNYVYQFYKFAQCVNRIPGPKVKHILFGNLDFLTSGYDHKSGMDLYQGNQLNTLKQFFPMGIIKSFVFKIICLMFPMGFHMILFIISSFFL